MAVGKKVLKIRAQAPKFHFKYQGSTSSSEATGRYYPAEDVPCKKGAAPVRNAPKLRGSITPGTVLVLLGGRFQGKRVVFLKQLTSGLLLVSGPYATNGVPLRRVNQRYVIATSTKVPVAGVDVSAIDDAFFAREKVESRDSGKTYTSEARKAAQAKVDAALSSNISKIEMLGDYLKAKFSLKNGDKPHMMKF